ncbi:MAG: ubiquinone biosynthesis protein UbiA, partial [Bacteroidia bacterium]
MITRSTLLHLRIPFSFFLLPVFLFALALTPNHNGERML